MAQLIERPIITLVVDFRITEIEARALDALAGYGDDAFIKVFYEHLGKSYMRDHEAGLRQFLKTVREFMPSVLYRTDEARKVFAPPKLETHLFVNYGGQPEPADMCVQCKRAFADKVHDMIGYTVRLKERPVEECGGSLTKNPAPKTVDGSDEIMCIKCERTQRNEDALRCRLPQIAGSLR